MSFPQETGRSQRQGDQSAMGPSAAYPQATQPQFSPSNFNYSTSDYPSLESDLNMADAFPHSITAQLQEASANSPHQNGESNAISVNTNGSVSAGMGPPHTPHKLSFSPTATRDSVDDAPDSVAATDDTNKRRRSKVSRACDECRRKKIKCDSADTLDGTIKTCTNCSKSNMTCEFSRIPMKRGPSKGYIKELSERVEKMESRQAAMGQPGYRQSFDGSSIPDVYSQDDPMSAKRQFSFSSDIRNPFGPTDYQRERMPSAGGTWSTDFPTTVGSRDRGSLALAPDQRLPGPTSAPLWGDIDDLEPPLPKRRKLEGDPPSVKMDSMHLANYEDTVHPDFPLLPDRITVSNKILASAENTNALKVFATVIGLLPSWHNAQQNGNSPNVLADAGLFSTSKELIDALGQLMLIDSPAERTSRENLLLIWSCILMAMQRDFDIRTNHTDLTFANRSRLLKAAKELSEHQISITKTTSEEEQIILNALKEAKTLTNVLIRFDWFASGVEPNWSKPAFTGPRMISDFSRADYNMFTPNPSTKFLVRLAYYLESFHRIIHFGLSAENEYLIFKKNSEIERALYGSLDAPGTPEGIDDDTLLVRQVFEFIKLLVSLCHGRPMAPAVIMEHAFRLASLLAESPLVVDGPFQLNWIDYHLYTLTVITLLAFADRVPDLKAVPLVEDAFSKLRPLLEQKQAMYLDAIKVREQEGRRYLNFFGKDGDGREVQNTTWMAGLLKMIDNKPREKWAISRKPAETVGGVHGQEFLEDFLCLVRSGYGRVLALYAGREVIDSQE